MPRNAAGTYTLPAGNPVVSGTIIESTWANSTLADIANALTDSLTRDGAGGMTGPLRLTDGVVGTPSLAFVNETSSGLYRAAAGDVGLSILGNRILRLRSTGADVTGVLGVTGAINANGTITSAASVTFKGSGTGFQYTESASPHIAHYKVNSNDYGYYWRASDDGTQGGANPKTLFELFNDKILGYTSGSERFRVVSNGFFGIGTNDPQTLLHVKGGDILVEGTGEGGQITFKESASGKTAFIDLVAGSNALRLINGIGGTSTAVLYTGGRFSTNYFTADTGGAGYVFSGDQDTGMTNPSDGNLRFKTNNVDRFGIAPNGNVFVSNNLSGGWNESQFTIEGVGQPAVKIGFHAQSAGAAAVFKYWGPGNAFEARNGGDTGFVNFACAAVSTYSRSYFNDFIQFAANGDGGMGCAFYSSFGFSGDIGGLHRPGIDYGVRITVNSNQFYFQNGGTGVSVSGWTTFSDRRLKENFRSIADTKANASRTAPLTALNMIDDVNPYIYERSDIKVQEGFNINRTFVGFVAQEVEAVLPEAVSRTIKGEGADAEEMLTLDAMPVVALLFAAVKELKAEVAALKAVSPA